MMTKAPPTTPAAKNWERIFASWKSTATKTFKKTSSWPRRVISFGTACVALLVVKILMTTVKSRLY